MIPFPCPGVLPSRRIYHILVRDLLLMCSIGIHPHERLAPQRVRINADLTVAEAPDPGDDDIVNVLNYEAVITGITDLVGRGHINLVETLAEQVAALCLKDARVEAVRLRIEKLDVYAQADSVGIEIERRRPPRPEPTAQAAMVVVPWVVKLSGSIMEAALIPPWLDLLATAPLAPAVIVPGGGPFLEPVRAARRAWEPGEATARRMALLAMEQYGHMLAGLEPRLALAETVAEIGAAMAAGRSAVWLPMRLAADRSEIAEHPGVTSDSLAAWLAGQVRAERLLLVKSAAPPPGTTSAVQLARMGLVDAAFPRFSAGAGETWCVHGAEIARVRHAVLAGQAPGTRVLPARADEVEEIQD